MNKSKKARDYTARMIERIVPLAEISPHPENPRIHPDTQITQLKSSHEELGQFEPVILWQRPKGYTQVKGHGYAEGVKLTPDEAVRAWILPEDTPPEVVKQIMLASNLHALNSYDDPAILGRLLQEQQDMGADLEMLGSGDEALREMLESLGDDQLTGNEDEEDEQDAPEVEAQQTRVKHGDIWQLGRHKIACLDSCIPETYQHLFHQELAHMVWSDPPYGISIVATNGYVGGGEAYDIPFGGVKTTRGDVGGGASHIRKTGKPYIADKGLRGSVGASKPFGSRDVRGTDGASNMIAAGKYYPVIGDDSTMTAIASYRLCAEWFPLATQIWWGANYYANALPPSSCWIVWDKENTGNFADAELAWCSEKTAIRIFRHMWNGLMKDSEKGVRRVHPTQKPIALAEWAFEKYGKERDVIYDPFLGSGISLIAAENLGRTVIGCELSPDYIDVCIRRWEAHTGQTATLLERVEETSHA